MLYFLERKQERGGGAERGQFDVLIKTHIPLFPPQKYNHPFLIPQLKALLSIFLRCILNKKFWDRLEQPRIHAIFFVFVFGGLAFYILDFFVFFFFWLFSFAMTCIIIKHIFSYPSHYQPSLFLLYPFPPPP